MHVPASLQMGLPGGVLSVDIRFQQLLRISHNWRIDSLLMKAADWAVRAIVVATFVALLLAPEKWGFPLGGISFGVVGAWALLYPQGILGWVKTAHHSIDVDDPSLWWVPRLIGGFFVAFALLIAVFRFHR
jgi:hypothetical protein